MTPIATGLLAVLVVATVAHAARGWQIVSSGSSSGGYTAIAIRAKIHDPKTVGIRLIGSRVQVGKARVLCTKGSSVRIYSRRYKRAGTYKLPSTRRADLCLVTASIGGGGRVTVQILKT